MKLRQLVRLRAPRRIVPNLQRHVPVEHDERRARVLVELGPVDGPVRAAVRVEGGSELDDVVREFVPVVEEAAELAPVGL